MEMNPREAFTQKLLEDYLTPEAVPQVQITPFPDEEEETTIHDHRKNHSLD